MEFQKLCHFADIYRFVLGFFERFHFTGGTLYNDPAFKKAGTIGLLLITSGIGAWIHLFLYVATLKGSATVMLLTLSASVSSLWIFRRPLGLKQIGARESQ